MDKFIRKFLRDLEMNFGDPGVSKIETGVDDLGEWVKQTFHSGGSIRVMKFYTSLNSTPQKRELSLEELKKELEISIEKEEYELAAELRDKIKELESESDEIGILEAELQKAISNQDFERAIEIRDILLSKGRK